MAQVKSAVVLLSLVGVLALAGTLVASASYQQTPTHVETVDNETVTQDVGNLTPVTAAGERGVTRFYGNETVRAGGSELTAGTDYTWNTSTGQIAWINSSATTDGAAASISYAYDARPAAAVAMVGPIAAVYDIAGILPLVVVAGAIFAALNQLRRRGIPGSGGGR
jgi:hypothetical protein